MKRFLSKILLLLTVVVSIGQQVYYYDQLPYKVAIHYNLNGIPNNFASKLTFVLLQIGVVLFMVVVVVVSNLFLKHGSDNFINIPNRAYWLAPQRRERTLDLLSAFVYWLGVITNVFLILIAQLLINANITPDFILSDFFWAYLIGYLGAIFISIVIFFRILNSRKKDLTEKNFRN